MENILLLHIGTPKTGTSSLQHFLYNNRGILMTHSWDYPDLKSDFSSIHDYANCKEKNGNIFYHGTELYSYNSDIINELFWKIEEKISDYNVVISAEEIYEYETEKIISLIKERIPNLIVIIYLRRQDKYVESRWNQIVKDDRCYKGGFDEYLELSCSWNEGHYYEKLEKISKIIGLENIIVRIYEEAQMYGGNVITDFCKCIGIDDLSGFAFEDKVQNERLCSEMLEVKRIINEYYDVSKFGSSKKIVKILMDTQKAMDLHTQQGYFTKEEREKYLMQYRKENTIIAKKYLKRGDGVLFEDSNLDIEKDNAYLSKNFELSLRHFCNEITENTMYVDELKRILHTIKE
jgi:hypothetical protein